MHIIIQDAGNALIAGRLSVRITVGSIMENFFCRTCVGKQTGGSSTGTVSAPKSAYGASKPAAKTETKTTPSYGSDTSSSYDSSAPGQKFYTYDALKDPKSCPTDIDKDNKEIYLADDVFLKMFKMDKATFAKLPQWKKKRLKQKVNLF